MNSFQAAAAGSDVETAAASVFGRILNRVQTAGRLLIRALAPVALGRQGLTYGLGQMGAGGGFSRSANHAGRNSKPRTKDYGIAGGNIFQQRQAPPSVDTLQRQGNPYSDLNDESN